MNILGRQLAEWLGRHRARRLFVALGIVVAVSATAVAKPDITQLSAGTIEVKSVPLDGFTGRNPGQTTFGRLTWRGGLRLTSASDYFGGISGLVIAADGRQIVAVADSGSWLRARLTYQGERLAGLADVEVGPLTALKGKPLARPGDRDAEAIALVSGTTAQGDLLIAFEQNRRIGHFTIGKDGIAAPGSYLTLPPEVRKLSGNKSLESVAVIAAGPLAGSVVAFGERSFGGTDGDLPGWIIGKKGSKAITLEDIAGFDVTDMAPLPDGGLAVLERRFRWSEGVQMRVRRIAPAELTAGGMIEGEVLFTGDQAFTIDNMEGIAAHQGANGETILTLISDDNFSPLQRTLLLQFAITDEAATQ